jgi:hypothetical protein
MNARLGLMQWTRLIALVIWLPSCINDVNGSGSGGITSTGGSLSTGGLGSASGGAPSTGGAMSTGGTPPSTGSAGAASFYDPVSTEHITTAYALVRQYAAGHLASPEVRFLSVMGVPTGAPGITYDMTPLRWTYQFSACDGSAQPCANTLSFTLDQPGLTVAGPFAGLPPGLSLLESEFRAAVPLDFAQLLAGSAPNQAFCPIGPTALGTQYISLQGGVKSGSGNALWYWTFECANVVDGLPVYRKTNGDPVT